MQVGHGGVYSVDQALHGLPLTHGLFVMKSQKKPFPAAACEAQQVTHFEASTHLLGSKHHWRDPGGMFPSLQQMPSTAEAWWRGTYQVCQECQPSHGNVPSPCILPITCLCNKQAEVGLSWELFPNSYSSGRISRARDPR